jgi:hypothetical protein
MQSRPLMGLSAEGERRSWQRQYAQNALASLGQIQTEDQTLAGHILEAEKALRRAISHINAAIDGEGK